MQEWIAGWRIGVNVLCAKAAEVESGGRGAVGRVQRPVSLVDEADLTNTDVKLSNVSTH